MRSVAVFAVALIAVANAANFLEGKEPVPSDTMIAKPSEEEAVDIEDAKDAQLEGSIENLDSESTGEDEDMDISDGAAEDGDEDEATASLLQKPKSSGFADEDETTALATNEAVEDGAAENDIDVGSEETDKDDSDVAGSSEKTFNGNPLADDSDDPLKDERAMGHESVDLSMGSPDTIEDNGVDEKSNVGVEMEQLTDDVDADDSSLNLEEDLDSVHDNENDASDAVAAVDDSSDSMEALSGDADSLPGAQNPSTPKMSKNEASPPTTLTAKDGDLIKNTSVQSEGSNMVSAHHQELLATADAQELKQHILANPAFREKVQKECQQHPEAKDCEKATSDAVMCQLLRAAKPSAADQLCAKETQPVTASASSLLQRRSEALEQKIAAQVIHDLYAHFDKRGLIDFPVMKSDPQHLLTKTQLTQHTADTSQDSESDTDGELSDVSADMDVVADDDGNAIGNEGDDGIDEEASDDDNAESMDTVDAEEGSVSVDDSDDDIASLSETSPVSTDSLDMASDGPDVAQDELLDDAGDDLQPLEDVNVDKPAASQVPAMGKTRGSMPAELGMRDIPGAMQFVANAHATSVTEVDASNASAMASAVDALISDKPHLVIRFTKASPDVLKQQIFANTMFKQKVSAYCAKFPAWHLCEEITGVVMYCQLLQKAKPAEAQQLCTHGSNGTNVVF